MLSQDFKEFIQLVAFEDADATRVSIDIDGTPVVFIDLQNLLQNKAETGRPQDLADMDHLSSH